MTLFVDGETSEKSGGKTPPPSPQESQYRSQTHGEAYKAHVTEVEEEKDLATGPQFSWNYPDYPWDFDGNFMGIEWDFPWDVDDFSQKRGCIQFCEIHQFRDLFMDFDWDWVIFFWDFILAYLGAAKLKMSAFPS